MADYKHGAYGMFAESIGEPASSSGTVAVYVGAAPVNLVRGYAAYVNVPVKLNGIVPSSAASAIPTLGRFRPVRSVQSAFRQCHGGVGLSWPSMSSTPIFTAVPRR